MANFKINTPNFSHLTEEDYNHIYSPSEDSFLLIDAFENDMENILKLNPSVCLEIGLGSGVVITALGTALGDSCKYFGTDINPIACEKAKETGRLNGVDIETTCCDLISEVHNELKGAIDILIFNPPYVPTSSTEVASGHLESTWAGGIKGREVMDRLFENVSSALSEKGVFYLVVEKQNKPIEIERIMESYGFVHVCVLTRKNQSETLSVLKFERSHD